MVMVKGNEYEKDNKFTNCNDAYAGGYHKSSVGTSWQ